ncbi:DUF418 domain-containing protein [Planomonospora corallina]|uniref:DUF418 domain-containing protein n=1 Tax=Planomonospora corallina TaxID=1806052 RepID=A0ABV8IDD6_9ACTN
MIALRNTLLRRAGTRGVSAPGRLHELDALRGFALCGIMVVNTWQHTCDRLEHPARNTVDWVVDSLFQAKFFPIFSFLFGMSLVLFLRSAGDRSEHPRLVLLRRLAVLACLGAAHRIVNPDEVLLPYAGFGAMVLLPASFLPDLVVLVAGIGATVWGVGHGGGGALVGGLFLLGMAAMEFPLSERLLAPAFLLSSVLAAGLVYLWIASSTGSALFFRGAYTASGLACSAAYGTGLLLLLRTRLRAALMRALTPLGRMALTNYLLSTVAILGTLPLLVADPTRLSVAVLSVAVLAAQVAFSRWWLARYRYGPMEWLWRCLTWLERVPNRRAPAPA